MESTNVVSMLGFNAHISYHGIDKYYFCDRFPVDKKCPFYGRKDELRILNEELETPSASLVVIRGRRRIGKSRLIEEFSKGQKLLLFTGLPPTTGTTLQNQMHEFALQMARALNIPLTIKSDDWTDLFVFLAQQTSKGPWLVVFDEISWIGSKAPGFLGKLRNAWDLYFSKNPELMLILCGSVSSWIQKNILSHTGFLGRVSIDLVIDELPLKDCCNFWGKMRERIAPYEILKIVGVTGGVPKYLEEIIPEKSAEYNIQRLCFRSQGLLFCEFDQIFSDLFSRRQKKFRKIVEVLAGAPQTLDEICEKLNISKGGMISECLVDLETAGFVHGDWTWNLANGKISNLRKFRLRDNYVRFYLKYILPSREKILARKTSFEPLIALPNWSATMGYQFENLVITNRLTLFRLLQLDSADILLANPYFQRKTQRQQGCQIDFLIQTRQRTLYVVEIKFSDSKIDGSIIQEVQEKTRRLSYPKGLSIRTVLVHVNGVTNQVKESQFFDYLVDFSDLLIQ